MAAWAAGHTALVKAGRHADQVAAAQKMIADSLAELRRAAENFAAAAVALAKHKHSAACEAALLMRYEAAWCYRLLANVEIDEALAQAAPPVDGKLAGTHRSREVGRRDYLPIVPLEIVPWQPAEDAARRIYGEIIVAAPDSPLAARVRLELAEMCLRREQVEAALELLATALRTDPPLELAERLRVRLADCLLARGQYKAVVALVERVAQNHASNFLATARWLLGEAYFHQQQWNRAIACLRHFHDNHHYAGLAEISDRALLRLGQAQIETKKWDDARRTLEQFVARYPQSPWIQEGRYWLGRVLQHQNQFDQAIQHYTAVTRNTVDEVAARAQLQIGRCRLAQKRYEEAARELTFVYYTYAYPDPVAAALCEAGHAYFEMQKKAEAARLWQRVVAEYGTTRWADLARERLATTKP
jgi:TolA-binding protein